MLGPQHPSPSAPPLGGDPLGTTTGSLHSAVLGTSTGKVDVGAVHAPLTIDVPAKAPPVPMLHGGASGNATLTKLNIHVEVHVATAFVAVSGSFRVPQDQIASADPYHFILPLTEEGVMTSATLHTNPTHIHPRGPSPEMYWESIVGEAETGSAAVASHSEYDPSVTKLPINVLPGDVVCFDVTYMQPLVYDHNTFLYTLLIPLGKRRGSYGEYFGYGTTMADVCQVSCHLHANGAQWVPVIESIPMATAGLGNGSAMNTWIHSVAGDWDNKDLYVSYRLMNQTVSATLLVQDTTMQYQTPPALSPELVAVIDKTGFVKSSAHNMVAPGTTPLTIVLNPPAVPAGQTGRFARSVVFILDKSGSMSGGPLNSAIQALNSALAGLQFPDASFPGDSFAIIAFNNEFIEICPLTTATALSIEEAQGLVQSIQAGGTTNIHEPIKRAFNILSDCGRASLPFVVLVCQISPIFLLN